MPISWISIMTDIDESVTTNTTWTMHMNINDLKPCHTLVLFLFLFFSQYSSFIPKREKWDQFMLI